MNFGPGGKERAKSKVYCSANGGDKLARVFQSPVFPTLTSCLGYPVWAVSELCMRDS